MASDSTAMHLQHCMCPACCAQRLRYKHWEMGMAPDPTARIAELEAALEQVARRVWDADYDEDGYHAECVWCGGTDVTGHKLECYAMTLEYLLKK